MQYGMSTAKVYILIRAFGKVQEKLEKSAILFQRSASFAKKCGKVQFWPKSAKK